LSNITIVAISVGLPAAVNNPVPASLRILIISCNWTLLHLRQQQT